MSLERLWPYYLLLSEDPDGNLSPDVIVLIEDGFKASRRLTNPELGVVKQFLINAQQGDFYELYLDLKLGSRNAARVDGNHVDAVLNSAMAAEILIKHVSWILTWESNKKCTRDPEPTAASEKVTTMKPSELFGAVLSTRLKGNWDSRDEKHPVGAWRSQVVQLRNAVIHLGYKPTSDEARLSYQALENLEAHIKDRLAVKVQSYPITALFLLGRSGLEKRKALGKASAIYRAESPSVLREEYFDWLEAEFVANPYSGD